MRVLFTSKESGVILTVMTKVFPRSELAVMVAGPLTGIPKPHYPPPLPLLKKVVWPLPFLVVDTEDTNSAVSPC